MKSRIAGHTVAISVVLGISVAGMAWGCQRSGRHAETRQERTRPMKDINEVIRVYSDSLLAIPGVVGLYRTLDDDGRTCLKVMVNQKSAELEKRIPQQIEGYPVIIEETGEIRPMR
jgi:hypothetical protein